MKAKNRTAAWSAAQKLFPTDYIKDNEASAAAGYPIYKSTATDSDKYRFAQIADLNNRLEINDGEKTINIWIEEEREEVNGMTATVKSLTNSFNTYEIKNIVNIQLVAGSLVLTYLNNGAVQTTQYNSPDVIVNIQ